MVSHVTRGRIRWVSVILGVAATLLFEALLTRFVVYSVIFPYLNDIFEGPGGLAMNARILVLYDALSLLSLLSTFPLALFLGGLVVGGVVRSSPGLHGALSGAVVAAVGLAGSSANTLALLLNPTSDTPFDDAEKLLILTVGLCVASPVAILAGYLGGRLGGLLRRSRSTPRSAS
jgi:hypothetical protein